VFGFGAVVGVVLLGALSIAVGESSPVAASTASISYQNLGYPWYSASVVNVGQFDWGYTSCPSNDPGCFALDSNTSGASCTAGSSGCYGEADPWAYYLRNCTSFVAWYLANHNVPFSDFNFSSYGLGNGNQWLKDAQSSRWSTELTTGSSAEVGSVAVSVSNDHVMVVTAINSGGTITVEEYNQDLNGDGDVQTATPTTLGISGYIYYNNVPGSTTGTGSGGNTPPPSISGTSPAGATEGTPVTITGSNLIGATSVSFDGTSATITSDSASEIVTSVPSAATTGSLSVTTSGGTATTPFTVVPDLQFRVDITGDGQTDLVYIHPSDHSIWTFLPQANGQWSGVQDELGGFDEAGGTWLTGDVNGDGKTDLIYIHPGDDTIWTFLSQGNGQYTGEVDNLGGFDEGSGTWLTGDVKADGQTDLIYIHPGDHTIWTFLPQGNGQWTGVQDDLGGFDEANGIWRTGDVTGDGESDLIYIHPGDSTIWTFLSQGNGQYAGVQDDLGSFPEGSGSWMIGDPNGDGKADLIYIHPGDSTIWTFLSQGNGQYTGVQTVLGAFDSASGIWMTGDVDGDGDTDLIYVHPSDHSIWTFISQGNGQYSGYQMSLGGFDAATGSWSTGDANGNGKTDLIYLHPGDDTIWTFLSQGEGQYTGVQTALGGFDSASGNWLSSAYSPANPPAPKDVTSSPGTGSVTLSWQAPTTVAKISSYNITPIMGGVAQPTVNYLSSATTETVSGLEVGASYSFSIRAINQGGVGRPVTSSPVTIGTSPAITSAPEATFIVGAPGSYMVNASGTPSSAFSESGFLPQGLSFSVGGGLTGTPAAGTAGTYPLTITASNGVAPDANQSFTLTVLPFGITTTSLPEGSVYSKTNKVTYSASLKASGGTTPYKWSLVSGSSLPPRPEAQLEGCYFVISGKAKTAGTYSFTVKVVDSKTKSKPATQNTAEATLSITIG
jgi:surface antigen